MTAEPYAAPFTEVRRTDVPVVGGGPGGIGAAIAAARNGADATLVTQYGVLGGMGSVGPVGVRETRRIVGEYTLTADDLMESRWRAGHLRL